MSSFDEMIQKCEEQLSEYDKNLQKEEEYYRNLINDMTRSKLQMIGEILGGNYVAESELEICSYKLKEDICTLFKQIIFDQKNAITEIKQILMDQMVLKSQLKQENGCSALTCNQEHNMIAGGRGKDIVIWQQDQFQLKEVSVLKGHTGNVTTVVIYQSGDLVASSGGVNDTSIKLWLKQDSWYCIQTINEHKDLITDLKLTTDQEQLVSASDDKLIKIWSMRSYYYLECIQTISDHTNYVYWITLSHDSMFMASSSCQNQINIYKNEQTTRNPWKKQNIIVTKGLIHRVYFTTTDELLVQQEHPPQLIVYQMNQNNQFLAAQQLVLHQPDNLDILFPIFEVGNKIFLKNEQYVYVIKRLKTQKYSITQIFNGLFRSGCGDSSGECIILRNSFNKSIEIYQ